MPQPIRYVVYARKSTETEDKQILSIQSQLKEVRQLAARMGLTIVAELTESCSAKEPGRPVFSRLLKDIERGRVEGILSWKLDRLSRNPADGGLLMLYLGKGLLREILTTDGRYDGSGDSKFLLAVLFGAAAKVIDDLSCAVKRGNREVREQGKITWMPPLGYLKSRAGLGLRGTGRVVPDPERFPLVQRIWRELLQGGVTIPDVWRRARDEWGLTTRGSRRAASHPIRLEHVYSLLGKRFYAGQIAFGGEILPAEHKPMVTPSEFERVQVMLRRVGKTVAPRPQHHDFAFAGLLHCGHCDGRLLTGEEHLNRQGRRYVYYRCGRKSPAGDSCYAPAPSEGQVTQDVMAHVATLQLPGTLLDWTRVAIDWWVAEQMGFKAETRAAKQAELDRAKHRLARLTDLAVDGGLGGAEYMERRTAMLAEIEILKHEIEDPASGIEDWRRQVLDVFDTSEALARAWSRTPDHDLRELLRRAYLNFVVKDRKTKPELRFPYTLLDFAPLVTRDAEHAHLNLPHPSEIWPRESENALPGDARLRQIALWCTIIRDVRTRPSDVVGGPRSTTGTW